MNILHANTDPTLLTRLKSMLTSANRADIAVGYLFISGFAAVAEELEALEKVRVLVGRTDRATLDEIAGGVQQADALQSRLDAEGLVQRSAREGLGAQAVQQIGQGISRLAQDGESQQGVRRMRDLIAAGKLEIKTYPKGMLHAKAYLCWYKNHAEPGAAIVGSSNFTLAGFSGNTELNVRVTGDAEMVELKRWFDALWADAVDVTSAVLVELGRSWALASTPPYHVYLKALYEVYHDQLGAPELEAGKRGAPELAEFQLDAVRRGLRIVEQHGGCFIGDVVGLGKTYIGAELVRQLLFSEPPGRHPLIVCPAGLVPMWETVNERFGLGAAVISMSSIVPPPATAYDEETGEPLDVDDDDATGVNLVERFAGRGIVLVDEAHNFRNNATRRYAALYQYLWQGEHKVVLLSATPQNLGPRDIYYQLRLFLDDLDHGLNLEPLSLEEYFAAVQAWYAYRVEVENWQRDFAAWQLEDRKRRGKRMPPPTAPTQPAVPYATIDQVLNPVFLRRRRKDIIELYGSDLQVAGKHIQFPEPKLDNLTYRLDKVYARAGSFDTIQQQLNAHRGARYLATEYLWPDAQKKEMYRDLLRARNRVARLMRYLLFKRLESSVAAFRATLSVLVQSNRNFRAALDAGFVPVGQTATNLLSGANVDIESLQKRLAEEEEQRGAGQGKRGRFLYPVADFDLDRWRRDLDADHQILAGLYQAVGAIAPQDDDKLQRLRQFLAQPEVAAGKVLIFSEAEATVQYLHEQLNPGGADPAIGMLTGATRDSIASLVKRFAPRANLRPKEALSGKEIRILFATDIISEGQNLQDCNRVLNYDLHWNPVRLVQRFGRVDRIGTTHDTIYLHNTWPDTDVDAELTLTERLTRRIQAFHDFIGLDSKLLSEAERINPEAMYRIYDQKRLPDQDDQLDEVAAHQRGIALLQQIKNTDPALWRTISDLPDGIRSALVRPTPTQDQPLIAFQRTLFGPTQLPLMLASHEAQVRSPLDGPLDGETVILLKHGDLAIAYTVGDDLAPRPLTPSQLISAIQCEPDDPAAPLPGNTNERVQAAFAAAQESTARRIGRARKPSSNTRLRRYLSRHLKAARAAVGTDPEELRRIDVLLQIYLDHLPTSVMTDLGEVQRMEMTGLPLVRRLEAIRLRHRLNPPDSPAVGASPGEVMRIICSDGLL
jgi:HKD family nuclease